ncbi:hypothetical protein BLOT_015279 [Blomia tropicalis]|nr:hypothetical protein BLOT_015279 [Blomia tropicalis]
MIRINWINRIRMRLRKRFGDDNIVVSVVKSLMEYASTGFRSGFEASVRSLFNKPVTTAVYALSMLVGVVAMLAFYESPISPMPVPPLPDPPVGRFPPEHPVWPPPQQQQGNNRQGHGGPMQPMYPAIPQAPQQYNQRRSGPAPYFVQPQMNYPIDNHRSDKTSTNGAQTNNNRAKTHVPTIIANETSYNNYISKLTSVINDLNNNQNSAVLDQLKQIYGTGSETLNNKVIDYNNKRMAMESIKYNSTTVS